FFSSRRRHTRFSRDWSSDVCSSDLETGGCLRLETDSLHLQMTNIPLLAALHKKSWAVIDRPYSLGCATVGALYERPRCIFCAKRSEERRVGKECRSRWVQSQYSSK